MNTRGILDESLLELTAERQYEEQRIVRQRSEAQSKIVAALRQILPVQHRRRDIAVGYENDTNFATIDGLYFTLDFVILRPHSENEHRLFLLRRCENCGTLLKPNNEDACLRKLSDIARHMEQIGLYYRNAPHKKPNGSECHGAPAVWEH